MIHVACVTVPADLCVFYALGKENLQVEHVLDVMVQEKRVAVDVQVWVKASNQDMNVRTVVQEDWSVLRVKT